MSHLKCHAEKEFLYHLLETTRFTSVVTLGLLQNIAGFLTMTYLNTGTDYNLVITFINEDFK